MNLLTLILASIVMCIATPAHSFTNQGADPYSSLRRLHREGSMPTEVAVKPRVSYAQFVASQQKGYTVAQLIEKYIAEMDGTAEKPGVRMLGNSHRFTLRRIQRTEFAKKPAVTLRKQDIIEYCKDRIQTVCAASINQDVTFIAGILKYAGSAWDDCGEVTAAAIDAAKPFLTKHNLIGKSTPRHQRPTEEQNEALEALFAQQNDHARTKTDMVKVARWQRFSGRRIGETCALLWRDWNPEDQTILVRKMKDPKNRNKSKVVFLPEEAQDMLYELAFATEATDSEPRIFPYKSATCSARYTLGKIAVGIQKGTLRLHDSRRDCGSRLVEKGFSAEEAILVTGHETTAIFQRTYMKARPELLKNGPASRRA